MLRKKILAFTIIIISCLYILQSAVFNMIISQSMAQLETRYVQVIAESGIAQGRNEQVLRGIGQGTLRNLKATALVSGMTLALTLLVFLEKNVLRRLTALSTHVKRIGSKGSTVERIPRDSLGDELSTLSENINDMLQRLETSRQIISAGEANLKLLTENMQDMIFWVDRDGNIRYCSPSQALTLGYETRELLGRPFMDFVHPQDLPLVDKTFRRAIRTKQPQKGEARCRHKNGHYIWLECMGKIFYDDNDRFAGGVISARDVTERKEMEERLRYLSLHDPMTGLYNRTYFEQEMNRLSKSRNPQAGLIICDLDGLKFYNDSLGHDTGDRILRTAAKIIRESFREEDLVARIGGDEFAILLPGANRDTVKASAQRIAERVEAYNQHNSQLPLSVSIGFAVTGPDLDFDSLFREADNNMYREKLHRSRSNRSPIVQALTKALEARDFITAGHAERLQDLVVKLAVKAGVQENRMADLKLFAQFHDIGKVGIPDSILFKPGPLDEKENQEMQAHARIGHRIALCTPDLAPIADWILKHHEWWNGEGYPTGLRGKEIPLECRILAVVDAYDAMVSDRPYRKAMSKEEAIRELKRCAGIQFDPELVDLFIESLQEEVEQGQNGKTGQALSKVVLN